MTGPVPPAFTWGVATSAYQIEGAIDADGKGRSIWDTFVRVPGAIRNGDNGDRGVDHYHQWKTDVDLMADLGVTGYRFSLAWTRLLPDGTGKASGAGISFYDQLIDELLAKGITPYITLYHWDLPQALEDRGGWPARATVDAFVEYADLASRSFGDRVDHWITHNEPWVASMLGYSEGVHAPGRTNGAEALVAAHHILLSHGAAVPVIRSNAPNAKVGIALDCRPSRPIDDSPAAVAANRHFDGYRNRWFFDPVFGRGYPADMIGAYQASGRLPGGEVPFVHPDDMETIAAPIDFLGLNYYTSIAVRPGFEETEDSGVAPGPTPPPGYSEMGWESTPHALTAFLQRITSDYGPPEVLITENGASYSDGPDAEDRIRDERRIEYLRTHVAAVAEAVQSGVPVTGYFVWSLLDNFEWGHGYSQRFGLVWVDRETMRRIPKDSYEWYRTFIAASQGR